MDTQSIYRDIATRTGGNIYLGVVGPVRTGKSTFIKRFMETLVLPEIQDIYMRERAKDELPQSGSGKTVMTAEPKFVPEDAVNIDVGGAGLSVRLIDCVGYFVEGAGGIDEGGKPRMVTTPWFPHEIPMIEAAELGTRKVISEHSTVGIVITTDGSVADIPRASYEPAEERVVEELKRIGKPFSIVLNCTNPHSEEAEALRSSLAQKYDVSCIAVSCLELNEADIRTIIKSLLLEFPVREFGLYLPDWVTALPCDHAVPSGIYSALLQACQSMKRLRDAEAVIAQLNKSGESIQCSLREMRAGSGTVYAEAKLPKSLFYQTISENTGFHITDDRSLLNTLNEMASVSREYGKVKEALEEVRRTGYGIVYPSVDELRLAEPEIVRKGGKYSVKLKASAPSIHMILTNIETEVSPAIGSEKQSDGIISYLLQEFEGDTGKIWESNIFGKSLYDIAGEGLQAKIKNMPEDAQGKLQDALQRIVNEGSNGLICIIL